jgi:redox-sensitive bicupin YhaK (pirin superfamily)
MTIAMTIEGRRRDLGGFSVSRVLPSPKLRHLGPFVFFDHMGPADFAPGTGVDVRPHPHIGLATVTYLFEGGLTHRDSLGTVIDIAPGAVNWMTAGRGIVHSERSPAALRAAGHRLHGIQSWLALPVAHAETAPAFVHHPADTLPSITLDNARRTLIAGTAFGAVSPVATLAPMFYMDVDAQPGAKVYLPHEHEERAIYVVEGAIDLQGERCEAGSMQIVAPGELFWTAITRARVMMLGGAPLDGPRIIDWNFVSHDPERIQRARDDWRHGRFDMVPGETEFIPLPEDAATTVGKGSPTT